MTLVQFCEKGDLEGVKAALKRGDDVNTKDIYGETGLMRAVRLKHNSVVALLLNTPNWKSEDGWSALHSAVNWENIDGLKLLLSHPSITALIINQKDNYHGRTPVMLAVKQNRLKHLEVLAADPRVDLDTTDKKGRSLEKVARDPETRKVLAEAKQRREEKRRLNRLIRKQQRQVSNAPPSPSCSASAWRSWGRSSGRSWWRTGRSSLNTLVRPFTCQEEKSTVQFYKSSRTSCLFASM